MYRTWTITALTAELTEIAREIRAADAGDRPALQARFVRVELELARRAA